MTTIKIGFSKSTKRFPIFGKLIQLVQGTEFSHAYCRRKSESIGEYVYQASGSMVNFMGIDTFLSHSKPIKEFELEIEDTVWTTLLKDVLIKHAGKSYGLKSILAIGLVLAFNWQPKCLQDGDHTFICSEIIVEILDAAGVVDKARWGKPLDLITPKDIYDVMEVIYGNDQN